MSLPAIVLALTAPLVPTGPLQEPELILRGGPILTMDDAAPRAEAVAVRGGRIVAVGGEDEILGQAGEATKVVDLEGRTLLPGFVDGHGHCFNVGFQATAANLLSPPDYEVRDIASLQAELREWGAGELADRYGLILGFGYDHAQLAEGRHPTRHDLDAVSEERPILIIHQSGHLCVLNSKALEVVGLGPDSEDPPGGVILREADGRTPSGVLEEMAWFANGPKLLPELGPDQLDGLALAGQRLYAAFGYTMGQEGRSTRSIDETWARLATAERMLIDIVSYPDLTSTDEPFGIDGPWHAPTMRNGYRIGGVKLNFDGSPQGKTAYLTRPYYVPPPGRNALYRGYPTFTDDEVIRKIDLCYEKGWQFLVHCNGDAAIDQMIGGVKEAQAKRGKDSARRDVMVHCQTAREDQLDSMKELGIFPSFFGMHCFYWGDWHRDSVLGRYLGERISPARSAMRRGMWFSQHHDAPVALPSSIRILASVVTRRTRSGDVLGADQCIPVEAALKSLTLWAAYQHFEEATRGSIEVGKLADFVVLDRNPLEVPVDELQDLVVVETIKDGESIYRRDD